MMFPSPILHAVPPSTPIHSPTNPTLQPVLYSAFWRETYIVLSGEKQQLQLISVALFATQAHGPRCGYQYKKIRNYGAWADKKWRQLSAL